MKYLEVLEPIEPNVRDYTYFTTSLSQIFINLEVHLFPDPEMEIKYTPAGKPDITTDLSPAFLSLFSNFLPDSSNISMRKLLSVMEFELKKIMSLAGSG